MRSCDASDAAAAVGAALPAAGDRRAFAHASDRGHVLLLPTGYYVVGGAHGRRGEFPCACRCCRPGSLGRLASARLPLLPLGDGARPAASLFSLPLARACCSRLPRQPRSALQPAAADRLDTALGRPDARCRDASAISGRGSIHGADRTGCAQPWPAVALLQLPERLGYWPAFILFAGFAWFELIDPAPDDPARLAAIVAGYVARQPRRNADLRLPGLEPARRVPVGVLRHDLAPSPLAKAGRRRSPRSAWPARRRLATPALPPSGILFLLLALSSVSFDGLSRTFFWLGLNGVNPLEFPGRSAMVGDQYAPDCSRLSSRWPHCFFWRYSLGERLTSGRRPFRGRRPLCLVDRADRARLSFLALPDCAPDQRPVRAGRLSDPFGCGWNLFGTAYMTVSAGIASGSAAAWIMWNTQAGGDRRRARARRVGRAYAGGPAARRRRQAALSQLPLTI